VHIQHVEQTRTCLTRFVERFLPVSRTCYASLDDLSLTAASYIPDSFTRLASKSLKYKIEIKLRNHNVIDRQKAIDEVLQYVPPQHKIDLEHPQVVILLEIFKNVCGMSVLPNFYHYHRYSPSRIAEAGKTETDCSTVSRFPASKENSQ